MSQPLRVLLVEDSLDDAQLIIRVLRQGGYDVTWERVETAEAMRAALEQQPWNIVLSDYQLPRFNGQAALRTLQASGLDLPFIIISGTIGEDVAVATMKAGAHDYLMKGNLTRLVPAVQRELHEAAARRERQRAEEQKEQYFKFFRLSINPMCIADPLGCFLLVNPAFTELTGFTELELAAKPFLEFVHPEDRRRTAEEMALQVKVRPTLNFENRYVCKNGTAILLAWTAYFDGKTGVTYATAQDITERKLAEAALRASERKFQSIFEQAAVGVTIAEGPPGRFVHVNRRFCEMMGYTADELLQLTADEITRPDTLAADDDQVKLFNQGIIPKYSREKCYCKKDGSAVWVRIFVAPLDPSEKKPTLRIGVCEDITERKSAERQLREQAEILANSHEGVMIVNPANEVTLWNRGAQQILGWTAAEAQTLRPEQLFGIDDFAAVSAVRARVERDGFSVGEVQARARDGRKLTLDSRITLIRDEQGRPRARLNIFADITEKKQLEEKFFHAQRLESIGMLAAGIAHDLNNVLAPIVFAAPLLRGSLATPRDLKILDTLEQSAGRGAGLVKQILGFAHSTTGEFRPTQVKHLARDIINVIEETFPKSIQLEHEIPVDLWPVQGNATQIHQVLLNLCVNARDAMPAGGTLRLTVANRRLDAAEAGTIPGARMGAWLELEVADTGTGISPEVLEHIWTPFFTTKREGKGTGLGLSTVRSIVLSHRGFVELRTKVGAGTTFRVFLPALETEAARPSGGPPASALVGHGELILVVDDDKAIRDLVAVILGNHGYRVLSCADGMEAVTLVYSRPGEISLVVTDADMPRIDGVTLVRTLLQLRPEIRLLAMSGLSREETGGLDLTEIQKLAHAFLAKPFTPEDLLGAVHELLHSAVKT